MVDDRLLTCAVVREYVPHHDHVDGVGLESGVLLTTFSYRHVGQRCRFDEYAGSVDRCWIAVDADHPTARPDGVGQRRQHRAWAAAHVGNHRSRPDPCQLPRVCLVHAREVGHHPIALHLRVAQCERVTRRGPVRHGANLGLTQFGSTGLAGECKSLAEYLPDPAHAHAATRRLSAVLEGMPPQSAQ
jgi:hypothetical protein